VQDKIDEFMEEGFSFREAEEQALKWIKDKAALHDPDQIAGGNPLKITGMGDSRINSSIGSQWKSRIGNVDKEIRRVADTLSEEEKKLTYLNVRLKSE